MEQTDKNAVETEKADLFARAVAAIIDGLIAGVMALVPFVGFIASAAYMLFKEALMYRITGEEMWKNKSIGKKLMKLEVAYLEGDFVDLAVSAKRNLPLAIGSIIGIIPILGWVIGPIVGLIVAIVEIILVLTDKLGHRMGDRWANTQVIMSAEAEKFETDENID